MMPRWLAWEGLLLGAVPKSFTGAPKLPDLSERNARGEMQPAVARIPVEFLPDHPVAYEALDALYLNSEKALEVKEPQAEALLTWVRNGGHLIVAVEQASEVNALPWLRTLLPCTLGAAQTRRTSAAWHAWLTEPAAVAGPDAAASASGGSPPGGANYRRPPKYDPDGDARAARSTEWRRALGGLARDPAFEGVDFTSWDAKLRDARITLAVDGVPLAISASRGRGQVTTLLFSPEREPFRSWKQRDWFWGRLLNVPPEWFVAESLYAWGGTGLDGVYGGMIDSRQVRKLPVKWLLLLLVVYLVVIGPFDQWVLKRLNRQMLTWVTFPLYVALFSLLIYYIGYRLRAGETEWNELHLVDVLPRGQSADLRGRSYLSIYSPVNARYRVASDLAYATLRGEFVGAMGGGREGVRAEVVTADRGFQADVYVPVWTSQLLVSDWVNLDTAPLQAAITGVPESREFTLRNQLGVSLEDVRVVLRDRVFFLGRVEAGASRSLALAPDGGQPFSTVFQSSEGPYFLQRAQSRQQAFGSTEAYTVGLNPANLMAASLYGSSYSPHDQGGRQFLTPAGLELNRYRNRGDAVVLSWAPGHAAAPGMRRFEAVRSAQNTYFRMVIPSADFGRPLQSSTVALGPESPSP
jgi:hypothetical protein